MSFGEGGLSHNRWFYSLNSKQDDSRGYPTEISAHPSKQQPMNLFLSKAANQETPVIAKPLSAPRLGDFKLSLCLSVGNLGSLPVPEKPPSQILFIEN